MGVNLHPKVKWGAIGAAVGSVAGGVADAVLTQCGGPQGLLSAAGPVVIAALPGALGTIGTLVFGYLKSTGDWQPKTPTPPAVPPAV